jgi:putative transposase
MQAEKANFPVSVMCHALGVNRTSFHDWERRAPSDRALSDAFLIAKIKEIHATSDGTYGARRVHAELRLEYRIRVGRKRVERLMRAAGISGVVARKRRRTTVRLPGVRVAPDLLERDFRPDGPNQTWSADITYVSTWEGFLYLAHVQDLFSRLIVGWSMADHLRAELVIDALEMGLHRRRPNRGLIHHSDQGCQYTAVLFGKRCANARIEVSMGSTGDCYDNAVCETFHATLKKEKIYRQSWRTRAEARAAIFQFIEGWYNPRRRHSTLAYLSPIEFERRHAELGQPAVQAPISDNGSVASIAPRASDALTTRRVLTGGVDFAADALISPENAPVVQTGPAQAATDGSQRTNADRWPLRSVVNEQAR